MKSRPIKAAAPNGVASSAISGALHDMCMQPLRGVDGGSLMPSVGASTPQGLNHAYLGSPQTP